MAGSNKWFIYETDDGTEFAILRDESNTEAVNGSDNDYIATDTVVYALPRNVKPRMAVYRSGDGLITRNIVALTPAILAGVGPEDTITDAVSSQTLSLSSKVGEVVRLPKATDSGLTDGDAT